MRRPRPRLRDRWAGWHRPAFDRDLPRLEPWAVYVFELPGAARTWLVVGRLLQRPWSRVGGGGEHDTADPGTPAERAAARDWLQRRGLLSQRLWMPCGTLWRPGDADDPEGSLRKESEPYNPPPTTWRPRHVFDSLAAARDAAQRMANVLCPHNQTRRSWPGGREATVDGRGLPELAPEWLHKYRHTLRVCQSALSFCMRLRTLSQ